MALYFAPIFVPERTIPPGNGKEHFSLAREYDFLGDLPLALEQARIAQAAAPDEPETNVFLAQTLLKLLQHDEAEAILKIIASGA